MAGRLPDTRRICVITARRGDQGKRTREFGDLGGREREFGDQGWRAREFGDQGADNETRRSELGHQESPN